MVARRTNISDILRDTKELSKLVIASSYYTVHRFIEDINDRYGTDIKLEQAREYIRYNGIGLSNGKLHIETFGGYLRFLKDLKKTTELSKKKPTLRSKESRRLSRFGAKAGRIRSSKMIRPIHTKAFYSSNQELH